MTQPAPSNNGQARTKEQIESSASKPQALSVEPHTIPHALRELNQWVAWRYERIKNSNGRMKWTKVPLNPKTGQAASSTDATTWTPCETALAFYRDHKADGIGFVFSESDPFAGVDLDDCIDPVTGEIQEWAARALLELDSYTEVSPSGTGLKVFLRAVLKPGRKRQGKIEIYDRSRYFAVTGVHVNGTPTTVQPRQDTLKRFHAKLFDVERPKQPSSHETPTSTGLADDDAALIEKAKRASNGAKFAALWGGDTSSYDSASQADFALCAMLAFWVGPDESRIDRLVRASGLFRDKWDEKRGSSTYGQLTIANVLKDQTQFFKSSSGSRPVVAKKVLRTLAPYQPFPVDALPSPVDVFVTRAAEALGCDPAYLALPALAVVASAIGNTRVIELKKGWEESSIVWTVSVGDSGTLKTPAYLKAVGPLFRIQKNHLQSFRQDIKAFERSDEDSAEKPKLKRVVCSDTTIEKLAEILEDNPRGILVARDELAGWLGSFTRYKGKQGGTDLPNWLEMHRAGNIMVDRKTGERRNIFVPRATASVTGGIQPGVLARSLTPEFLESGLAARLLMAMPPKMPKRWTEKNLPSTIQKNYESAIDRLLEKLDFDEQNKEKVPHVLELSPLAKKTWIAFYNEWALEQSAVEGEMAAAYSKLEAYAARFALLHHVVHWVSRKENDRVWIEKESIDAGIALCRWFAHEAKRIYCTFSETPEDRDTRRLVEFIQTRGGRVTVRELQNSNSRKYPSAEHAKSALDSLVTDGRAQWIGLPSPGKGGWTSQALQLLPTADTSDTRLDYPPENAEGTANRITDSLRKNHQNPRVSGPSVGSVGCRNNVFGDEPTEAGGKEFPNVVGQVSDGSSSANGVYPKGDAWEGD